jgi:arginyl-tRNA synthetase
MVIKREGARISTLSLREVESLYQRGNSLVKDDESALVIARQELVKLQSGDPENLRIWGMTNDISQRSFDEIYSEMGVPFDYPLGESFCRDKVDRVDRELTGKHIDRVDNGALCVFYEEHDHFNKQPFIIKKADSASNYARTDLATILYRAEMLKADELIYVTDGRQHDHFQQLFLRIKNGMLLLGANVQKCNIFGLEQF